MVAAVAVVGLQNDGRSSWCCKLAASLQKTMSEAVAVVNLQKRCPKRLLAKTMSGAVAVVNLQKTMSEAVAVVNLQQVGKNDVRSSCCCYCSRLAKDDVQSSGCLLLKITPMF